MITDPKLNESPSGYMDRMLGELGSPMRKAGGESSYQYWLMLWDAKQKENHDPKTSSKNHRVFNNASSTSDPQGYN